MLMFNIGENSIFVHLVILLVIPRTVAQLVLFIDSQAPSIMIPLPRLIMKWVPKPKAPAPPIDTVASHHAGTDFVVTAPVVSAPLVETSTPVNDSVVSFGYDLAAAISSETPTITVLAIGACIVTEPEKVSPAENEIVWNSYEHAWILVKSEMRYSPTYASYHMFVSGDGEELRLYYHVEGEELVLSPLREDGDENRIVLVDVNWDWKYLYSCGSVDYIPNLVALFADFIHVIVPMSDDDDYGSSPRDDT